MAARFLEVQEILSDGSKLAVMVNLDHIVQIYKSLDEEEPDIKAQINLMDGDRLDVAETYDQIRQALGVANIG